MWIDKKIIILKILLLFLLIITTALIFFKINISRLEFYLNGADEITLDVGNEYNERGFTAKIGDKDIKDKVIIKSNLDTNKVGNYTIDYKLNIKYLSFKKTLKRKINVIDTIDPVLNVNSNEVVYLDTNEQYTMPTYEANDNVDGNITDEVKVDSNLNTQVEGTYHITYSVKDSSNNKVEKKITIHVEPKYKNSYIEISISNQKLNYYEKGEIVLTSDIVTGINNGTPTGNYKVLNKARNVNLKGEDYVSFVNYWIAFIGHSYGMHDASWRSSFGGSIYKYNGSHGCVNMPYSKVQQLYNMVEIGTPVYIKY